MSETPAHKPDVTLRPVEPEDEPLLLELYASTRADELALTPWTEAQREAFVRMQFAAQLQHYQGHYPEAEHSIILLNGLPAGRIYLAREDGEFRILDITVLPEHRNSGAGGFVIKQVLNEAARSSRPVTIHVESHSPGLRLFERLGFRKVRDEGFNLLLEWRPPA
ncbi:MAG TPA: GNAT family N-acetyltransferase [Pyrinomonadaceae bacterium]|jgi:ribosomal protein S18 acetylase RimI-like enzyme